MALSLRMQRLLAGVRRWRSAETDLPLSVSPSLTDGDLRRLTRLCDDIVETRGGETGSRQRARRLGLTFATLDENGQRRFFDLLVHHYGHDDNAVDNSIDHVLHSKSTAERRAAENKLREALRPRRELILRRFVGLDGGLPFLIEMREQLRRVVAETDDGAGVENLGDLDADLRRILERWFDVGLLQLQQLTWDSPASLLEKLIEYEAVHAIRSWADLRRRLGPGRRCYAFVHPSMHDEPLIFVEVAFTHGLADAIAPLIGPGPSETVAEPEFPVAEAPTNERFDTAIFYSISNCHDGLAGVSLGDVLIKSVVERLSSELPDLRTYATLSPMPGFRSWLLARLEHLASAGKGASEDESDTDSTDGSPWALLRELAAGPIPATDNQRLTEAEPMLMALAADYIVNRQRPTRDGSDPERSIDPVAHFHFSNGARAEQINWLANPTEIGWDRGLGMMINYRYDLKSIEENHARYTERGEISASDAVKKLLAPLPEDGRR